VATESVIILIGSLIMLFDSVIMSFYSAKPRIKVKTGITCAVKDLAPVAFG
jgi:hypothetical protein